MQRGRDKDIRFQYAMIWVIADAGNERKLCVYSQRANAKAVDRDQESHSVLFHEYAWKKGEHPNARIHPDTSQEGDIIHVIEIKGDEEIAKQRIRTSRSMIAVAHFERLNNWLQKDGLPIRYQFNFLRRKTTINLPETSRERTRRFQIVVDVALRNN